MFQKLVGITLLSLVSAVVPARASSPFVEFDKVEIFRHVGEFNSQYSPWVMRDPLNSAQWLMYYCKNTPMAEVVGGKLIPRDRVWRAVSPNGRSGWTNDQVVIQGASQTTDLDYLSCSPGVVHKGSTWHIYYVASTNSIVPPYHLFHATSSDGVTWSSKAEIALSGISYFERPSPVLINGNIVLYIPGNDGRLYRRENSNGDGVTFSPAVEISAPRGEGRVTLSDGTFYYSFSKRYDGNQNDQPARIYLATSRDGLSFFPLEGPLAASSGTADWDSERLWSAHVVARDGELWAYYSGNVGTMGTPYTYNGSIGLRRFRMAADTLTQIIEAEDAARVGQSGTWMVENSGPTYSGGYDVISNTIGSQLTTTVNGRFVTIAYSTWPNRGIAKVFANSQQIGSIDMYAPSFALRRATFDLGSAQVAQIAIQVAAEKNPASSDRWLLIDRIDVGLRAQVAESEESPATVRTGTWVVEDPGTTYRNGAILVSQTLNDKLQTSLTGRYVTLTYAAGPNRGIATLKKNGVPLAPTVDMYSSTNVLQTKTWDLGSIQSATFAVVVSHTKRPASSGYFVAPDRLEAASVAPGGLELEDQTYVLRTGTWSDEPGAIYSGGMALVSNITNSALSANLYGRHISIAYSAYPNRGIAKLYRDGLFVTDIDMYALSFEQKRATVDLGATYQGKFELKVSGLKNPSSSGTYLVVDRIDAWDSSPQAAATPILNTCNFDSVPPKVALPAAIQVAANCSLTPDSQSGAGNSTIATFLAAGTATDECGGVTKLTTQVNGVNVSNSYAFPEGSTGVAFRWQDAKGNIGSAATSLRVFLPGDITQDGRVSAEDGWRYDCILNNPNSGCITGQNTCVTVQGIALTAGDFNGNGTIDCSDRTAFQSVLASGLCNP